MTNSPLVGALPAKEFPSISILPEIIGSGVSKVITLAPGPLISNVMKLLKPSVLAALIASRRLQC